MTEQDIEALAPQEPTGAAANTKLWRRKPVQIAGIVAIFAAAAGGWIASSGGTAQIHVRGTLSIGPLGSVDSTGTAANGDQCETGQGYSDISAGTAVTIGGGTGQTLAVGALSAGVESDVDTSAGMPLGTCVFSFDVVVPGGQNAYTVTISHRGTQTFTPQQVAAGIRLTLG